MDPIIHTLSYIYYYSFKTHDIDSIGLQFDQERLLSGCTYCSYKATCTTLYLRTLVPSTGSWGTSRNSSRLRGGIFNMANLIK